MAYMLVRHKVEDFSQWKEVFDSHSEAQQQAGLHVQNVFRNKAEPNEVFLLFEVADLDDAREFVSSPDVPEAQQQSGVVDEPDIYFLVAASEDD